tara:strand:- start:358 stop:693 length:336 start_codon:yes stop_codon:yes gene_type:complete
MNVSDKRLEEALIYRAESDEKHAELKTKVEFLEWQKKHKKGIFINTKCDEKTSFSIKEQKWYASDEYKDHCEKQLKNMEQFLTMDNKRKHAKDIIEIWRTIQANRRQGNVS